MFDGLDKISIVAAAAVTIAGVAFAGYQYREVHLPEFEELKVAVTQQQCIYQCQQVCRANRIPLDRCNCRHCHSYPPLTIELGGTE